MPRWNLFLEKLGKLRRWNRLLAARPARLNNPPCLANRGAVRARLMFEAGRLKRDPDDAEHCTGRAGVGRGNNAAPCWVAGSNVTPTGGYARPSLLRRLCIPFMAHAISLVAALAIPGKISLKILPIFVNCMFYPSKG
jgi:hypothetical protein